MFPGLLGLVSQLVIFILVYSAQYQSQKSKSLFYAAVASVFGYSLVLLGFMTIGIPWGTTNVFIFLALLAFIVLNTAFQKKLYSSILNLFASFSSNLGAVAIAIVLIAYTLLIASLKSELSVDGQLYHGPVLAQLIQQGTVWGWSYPSEYLFYSDLTMVSGINLATFTGVTNFDDAIQVQHLFVLFLGINWALSRRYSSSFARACFALLLLAAPVIWLQPRILYVDLAYGTAVASSILLLALNNNFRKIDLLIIGSSIGAVVATKPAGVLTGALLSVVCIALIFIHGSKLQTRKLRESIFAVITFIIPVLFGFGFYIRNFVQFGSPTFPVKTDFGPFHFFGILELSTVSGDPSGKTFDISRFFMYLNGLAAGATGGFSKLDYDPRLGGFGFVPLIVLIIALLVFASELFSRIGKRNALESILKHWKPQIGIVALVFVLISIQPAPTNSRYVIGPTIALEVAVLLITSGITVKAIQIVWAVIAFLLAMAQIGWIEKNMYPGLLNILDLRKTSTAYQPISPGNPWGQGKSISWLPQSDDCYRIAIETSGGVTSGGLMESTRIATFPYGLYGDRLCNSVNTISERQYFDEKGNFIENYGQDRLFTSQYLVVYSNHAENWISRSQLERNCFKAIATIEGDVEYPQNETVLQNICTK